MGEIFREMNLNPWEQGFCWFWCNDDEIFFYTEADFERRAEELAKAGITVIMTFSLTHFRMGFYPYWKELNESLTKLVRACHKWGIRVVEHHSASLTPRVLDEGGWEKLDGELIGRSKGTATYDHWKKIFPFLTYDYTVDGTDIRTFMQIDGRTGEYARNRYGAFTACYNNPDYRRIYFDYMKSVVATGIDGIMNLSRDDGNILLGFANDVVGAISQQAVAVSFEDAMLEGVLARKCRITVNVKQLAEELGIRPQSVSEAIFFLEKRGEVRKEADANDRRVRRIFLTEQGEERKKMLSRMQEEHAEKFFSVLTASEKQTLLSILEKINAFQEEKEKSQCRHP